MYLFLVFALPLAAFLVIYLYYPQAEIEATRRALLRGLLAALPLWFLARILGGILPSWPGSTLGALHEWADRFLPYTLFPALAYAVFYRYGERLPLGAAQRRLTAFYAGVLSPFGLGEMTRIWGNPSSYTCLVLPFLLAAIILTMPPLIQAVLDGYGFGRVARILGGLCGTLAASCILPLYLLNLWLPALLIAAGFCVLAYFWGLPGLDRHAPATEG